MSNKANSGFLWSMLFLGYIFLYAPIIILMIYSFNENRLVTVWSTFSTKWYGELLQDEQMLEAAWMSLKLGVFTATSAVILGTLAGLVMTRFRRFRGQVTFAALITAPLVMPEVITGLSLLLMFVALEQTIGFPEGRGLLTMWIAHVTFCTAYVAVITTSRLRELDNSIEEAAMDLGAPPLKVFFVITLPIIAPALISGWLLAFTLSLDDLVIASFTSGPGSTTLPMVIYSSVRLGVSPKINALATIIILLVSTVVFISGLIMMHLERKRTREMQQAVAEALAAESAGYR
ncbi:ABC-type spermidine/putrescine transport system, permease component II [Beggiatoa alba B18LD]|uniref:ABC-type spermidine/putrescine transport system, permease component II n=1 Tax=Beggiatoa alba B18LD TaxID=395493 RepID=I3CC68_9GAMM|nr:ABC transporter permease subunit [Beggiatoa alba]EIJ41211.1 ABC-type spermidine/putrescine transport system, permease component II [Beggiatoa alba B18LD]